MNGSMSDAAKIVQRLRSGGCFSDSYGSKGFSDYVDLSKDSAKSNDLRKVKQEGRLSMYTKRQKQIIAGRVPAKDHEPSLQELRIILDKAQRQEDELVIARIYSLYEDKFEGEKDKPKEIDREEFIRLMKDLSGL